MFNSTSKAHQMKREILTFSNNFSNKNPGRLLKRTINLQIGLILILQLTN